MLKNGIWYKYGRTMCAIQMEFSYCEMRKTTYIIDVIFW